LACTAAKWGILVTPSLGEALKARRSDAGLTQDAVARQLGVKRPTLTQWEADRYRPSPDHIARLDQLYGAQGELIRLAQGARPDEQGEPVRTLSLADIFRGVADALVEKLVVDEDGRPLGWGRNLTAGSPSPLNTAYVVRTLQLLDDGRVDLHSLAAVFEPGRRDGWGYRNDRQQSRPEVTAVILAMLARLGHLVNVDEALRQLEESIDDFARSRPFVLGVVLEAVLAIRPDAALAHQLTRALLDSRTRHSDRMLWTMNAAAHVERTVPSLAHTARSTAVLRLARSTTRYQSEVDEATEMAVEWMGQLHKSDVGGAIEILERVESSPSISIHHFTSAWVIRSLAGIRGVPAARLRDALDVLWDSYSPSDRLWTWRDEGSLPSWMTLDAVSSLRLMAEAALITPFSVNSDGDFS
jgi:transcriptional regulator with XRE-family HTH domain